MTAVNPAGHPPVKMGKVGVLLVNLGTPDSTNWWDIRRYLKEFLSDRRVIEVNPLLWSLILNGPILTFRPAKTARAYKKIWRQESNESPLRYYTRQQAEKLASRFAAQPNVVIDWAMRYGNPSMDSRIKALTEAGCRRILLVPLYPHYAAATTATVCDAAFRSLMKMRWQPSIRVSNPYYDHPLYIEALADSLKAHLATLDWQPEVILASFHGIPKRYFDAGDPYHCTCQKTGRLLREKLGMDEKQLKVTFQSRFGPEEWLQPYTDKTIEALAKDGVKRMVVITPGFAADCVETLEEIAMGGEEIFHEHGGEHFSMVPCLNDDEAAITLYESLVRQHLQGWVDEQP